MTEYLYTKKLSVKKTFDVIVCGGGVAGVAAAVTAAGEGKSVLLLEKSNILGGLATLGLINLFVPMCNGRGKQIIFGLCEKWVRMSAQYGFDTIPEPWKNGEPREYTETRYVQRYANYIFALQLTEEVKKAGVELLFDCMACDPVMEGNVCRGVITESKSGIELYGCKMLIDVTGDCDVLRRAGIPTVRGGNFYTYSAKTITLEGCQKAVEAGDIRLAYGSVSGGGINLWGDNQPDDVPLWHGLTVEDVNDYLQLNQQVMLDRLKTTPRLSRDIAQFPHMPQLRTTCRLDGDYTLQVQDVYRHFDDSVCAINDFEHRDHLFEVPLRCLTRQDCPNLLTAGRSASGVGYAWDLLRVIPPAIITGQAAALTACHALDESAAAARVDIASLQRALERADIMVHFPDSYVPEDRTLILHGKNAAEIPGGHH